MADLLECLKAALADRYAIQRERGRGDMATVCVAVRLLAIVLLVAGCGDAAIAPTPDEPDLIVRGGDRQAGACYARLPESLAVEVRDRAHAPVPGRDVEFRVTQGDGWVQRGAVVADSLGLVTDWWTLGAPGPQVLEARLAGAAGTSNVVARFTATSLRTEVGGRRLSSDSVRAHSWPAAISGDRIVWGEWGLPNDDIYLYDLATNTERRITTDPAVQALPDISGDRIVWRDDRNGTWDIYWYDLATGLEHQLTSDPSRQSFPAIDGDRVVWQDDRHGNWDIYLYDFSIGSERRITTDTSFQGAPDISGDRIVWLDDRNGNQDIYLYDLATGTERRITTGSADQNYPAISGDRIVWRDWGRPSGVYLYDLTTGTEQRITPDASWSRYTAISGSRVVWVDYRHGKAELYVYDLDTATERRLTTDSIDYMAPAMDGDRITAVEDNIYRVHLYDMTSTCSPPAPPAGAHQW